MRRRVLEPLLWTVLAAVLVGMTVLGLARVRHKQVAQALGGPAPVLGTLPDFALVDSHGKAIGPADLRGKIWVADFIFTRCTGICPALTATMALLREDPGPEALTLVSISVDPSHDRPEVLRAYADRFGVKGEGWLFLTGEHAEIYRLVQQGFRLSVGAAPEGANVPEGELVTHSDRLVLVDGELRIRGYYRGNEPEVLAGIRADVARLAREASANRP